MEVGALRHRHSLEGYGGAQWGEAGKDGGRHALLLPMFSLFCGQSSRTNSTPVAVGLSVGEGPQSSLPKAHYGSGISPLLQPLA